MRRWVLVLGMGVLGCDDGAEQAPVDAAPDAQDARVDGAAADAAADAAVTDQGAPRDAALDASPDARADAADVGPDLDEGPRPDASPDAATDATADADPQDLAVDAALDLGPDLAVDADVPRERACFNEEDDDGDGRVDCADPDCRPTVTCIGFPEVCDNGVDDNGDDIVDCDDLYCHADPLCPPLEVQPYTDAELQAVLLVDCAGCHTQGGDDGELVLEPPFAEALVNVRSTQLNLMRVAPGKREDSYLFYKVRYRHHDAPGGGGGGEGMPPHAPWTAQKVERLGLWIDGLDD